MGLEVSVVKSPAVAEKLVQAFVLFIDKKMLENMELDEVVTQFYNAFNKEEVARLKKDKEDSDVTAEKLEKEVAKLKRRGNLTKKLSIDEFKSSEEYKETMEDEASSYFGKGV
ncbi:uncharacterized protein LOC130796216 [Actinidia eriantha]|uniref:uncharacterized protein LOC130796216 n=1 Tax=Actinidia eriantha TaxID=165200 RepID=UPI002590ED90|nr:uncharacterized protein LOC130796216 [Actinidia eriantha]